MNFIGTANFMEAANLLTAATFKKMAAILCLPLLFVPALANAQSSGDQHPLLSSKFQVSAGAFFGKGDYMLSANGNAPGTEIDFNRALGVDDSDASPLGAILWRFGEKWSLRMQAFRLNVDGKHVLDHDIQFGDYTFGQGSNVNAGLKTSVVRAFIGRTFSTGRNYEFGAGVGLHWMQRMHSSPVKHSSTTSLPVFAVNRSAQIYPCLILVPGIRMRLAIAGC